MSPSSALEYRYIALYLCFLRALGISTQALSVAQQAFLPHEQLPVTRFEVLNSRPVSQPQIKDWLYPFSLGGKEDSCFLGLFLKADHSIFRFASLRALLSAAFSLLSLSSSPYVCMFTSVQA